VIFLFFMTTMMLPLEVLMIPIFQMVKAVGFYNSFWGLIIPPAATPAGVFIVRQYFLTIPDEIMESARIDGAGETKIFLYLMVPLAKPAISVLAIFSFLWRWNDYMWPLVVIRDTAKYTVQLALASFSGQYAVSWGSLLAMSVLTMIPVLIIFLIFQKQFMKGMTAGAVKG
jgi:alpha-1,4-digalacturonate transport system permease protein